MGREGRCQEHFSKGIFSDVVSARPLCLQKMLPNRSAQLQSLSEEGIAVLREKKEKEKKKKIVESQFGGRIKEWERCLSSSVGRGGGRGEGFCGGN